MERRELMFAAQVGVVCLLWYGSSSAQNIVNKLTLQGYPYPLTIAVSTLLNNVLYAIPLSRILNVQPVRASSSYVLRTIVPISIGRAVGVSSAYFGLWKVPVSYAQTVKATMPVFTVLISRLILREHQSPQVYASLTPIVVGVFIASATELQFSALGLFFSLCSTCTFAGLSVLAKKVFDDTGMHPIALLSLNSQIAAIVLFPLWALKDGFTMWASYTSIDAAQAPDLHFLVMVFFSGLLGFVQSLCAFTLIHQLTTLSYAVSNASKRIAVISLSLLTLHNPVTWMNLFGMLLAIVGVFLYNRVKHREHKGRTSPTFLRRRDDKLIFDLGHMRSTNSDVRLLLSAN